VSQPTRRISAAKRTILVTGGGARNSYLMESLQDKLDALRIDIVETDDETIDFKEALITAFLGMRCLLGLPNVSREMTGSMSDTVSGSIHLPPSHSLPASFMFTSHSD
jgi:anhydro-N-acetylmuramic acid kinase